MIIVVVMVPGSGSTISLGELVRLVVVIVESSGLTLSLEELVKLLVVVTVTVIGMDVLDEAGYLLLRQLHAEMICVLISPSLHSVV
jgi:hypothetical protein